MMIYVQNRLTKKNPDRVWLFCISSLWENDLQNRFTTQICRSPLWQNDLENRFASPDIS